MEKKFQNRQTEPPDVYMVNFACKWHKTAKETADFAVSFAILCRLAF